MGGMQPKLARYVWVAYLVGLLVPVASFVLFDLKFGAYGWLFYGAWLLIYAVLALGPMYWWATREAASATARLAVVIGAAVSALLVHAAILLVAALVVRDAHLPGA